MARFVTLDSNKLIPLREIDERPVSYNVEMTEVTGGTFWKAYTEGAHIYCHSRKDGKNGYVYLVINNSWTVTTAVKFDDHAEAYVLSGKNGMRSRTMCLNGNKLLLGSDDKLPNLSGKKVSQKLELAPGACAFIVF